MNIEMSHKVSGADTCTFSESGTLRLPIITYI
jgi:hypothetical protein